MATREIPRERGRDSGQTAYRTPPSFYELITTLVPFFIGFVILSDVVDFWLFNAQVGNLGLALSGALSIIFTALYFYYRPSTPNPQSLGR